MTTSNEPVANFHPDLSIGVDFGIANQRSQRRILFRKPQVECAAAIDVQQGDQGLALPDGVSFAPKLQQVAIG